MEAAIDAGHIAAGVVSEPFVTYALLRGKKLIGEAWDPALALLATDKAIQEKSEAIQLFVETHQQAIHFLNKKTEDANQVLADVFNISQVEDYSPAMVVEKARENMNYDWQFSSGDFEYYQLLADSAYELGYIDQKLNLETLFDLTVIEGVVK
jgi:ABC-type nitrate/sulfonate/bicarbonate transport system substrate-binding protein